MNFVCLMGRLTADPELRRTANQTAVTSFTLAIDRRFVPQGQERQADFINCVAWRQTAEFICRYFHKGQRIALQGSLQSRQYTDRDGNKRTAYEVVVDNAEFCESKTTTSGYAPRGNDSQVSPYAEPSTAFSTAAPDDFEEITGDDQLPF
ncbi:MAG: single-stranded DNA-binding protein [Clostridia bacterium]|nr:single-stranded DNA-binding protein [Clostridia bacterium]